MAEAAKSLKVFVSYSRTDVDFADQLVLALDDKGFATILDRHDMSGGENWRERLGKLILSADAVVFILTEKSATSEICAWEVEEARRLGKRILPVTIGSIAGVTPPAALGDLNWIPFYAEPAIPGSGFYYGVKRLEEALSVDLDWLRAQTRYSERAQEWSKARPEDLLLRGEALKEAEAWLARTPSGSHPPDLVREYLAAGDNAEQHRQAAAKAQLEEREQALKTAEAAVAEKQEAIAEKMRMDRRLRMLSVGALVMAVVLVITAGAGILYSTRRAIDANDQRAAQFAQAAQDLNGKGDHAKAMLVALAGDPAAQRGLIEPFFRRDGNPAALAALERAYTHVLLRQSIRLPDFPMAATITKDGLFYVGADALKPAGLWRAGDDKPLVVLGDKKTPLDVVAFSRNGEYIVSSVRGEPVVVRKTGETASSWTFDLDRAVFGSQGISWLAISDDGGTVVATDAFSATVVWRRGETAPVATFNDPEFPVQASALSNDGNRLLVASDKRVEAWAVGGSAREVSIDFASQPASTGFDASGAYILTLTVDGKIFIHNALNGEQIDVADPSESPVRVVAISPITGEIAMGRRDGVVQTTLLDGSADISTIGGHSSAIISLAYSPDGRQIISGSGDHTIKVWDVVAPSQAVPLSTEDFDIYSAAFEGDGKLLLGMVDGRAKMWPAGAPKPEAPFGQIGGERIEMIVPVPNSQRFFVLDPSGKVWLRTLGSNEVPIAVPAPVFIRTIAVSPDGTHLLAGTASNAALWKIDNLKEPVWTGDGFVDGVDGVSFAADGQHFIIGGMARIEVRKIGDEKPIDAFEGIEYQGRAFAFMPVGDTYVMSLGTGDLVMRRIGQTEPIRTFRGHRTSPFSISFSADGAMMLTAGPEGAIYWRTGQPSPVATITRKGLRAGLLSPDGKRAVLLNPSAVRAVETWTADPMLFLPPLEKTRLACEALAKLGLTRFTAEDRLRYPVLEIAPADPCEELGFPTATPAKPVAALKPVGAAPSAVSAPQ